MRGPAFAKIPHAYVRSRNAPVDVNRGLLRECAARATSPRCDAIHTENNPCQSVQPGEIIESEIYIYICRSRTDAREETTRIFRERTLYLYAREAAPVREETTTNRETRRSVMENNRGECEAAIRRAGGGYDV